MLKIRLFCICKSEKGALEEWLSHYVKLCRSFDVDFEVVDIFSKKIHQAHKNEYQSLDSYSEAFAPYVAQGYCIALDPKGECLNSQGFAQLFKDANPIHLFIGGAYGLSSAFLKQCDRVVSLSPLTFSHKIAKIVSAEQVYRALSLLHNHPYHK